ncbi:MAG: hypothetical protein ABFS03_00925 [Chloroflexota bacterium]
MEFTNYTNVSFSAYGYNFAPGEAVDVSEESLAVKFGKYEQFKKPKAPKKKAAKKKKVNV